MRGAIMGAALLLSASSARQSTGLSLHDRHILAPVQRQAQSCLRALAPLSRELNAAITDGGPSSAGFMADDAATAVLLCAGGQRYGVQMILAHYPTRSSSGRLHVVLVRLNTLFAGGIQAAQSSIDLAAWAQEEEPGQDNSTAVAALEESAQAGLAQAVRARAALRPDLGNL